MTAGRSCKRSSPAAGLTVPRYGPGPQTAAGLTSLSGCLERIRNIGLCSFPFFFWRGWGVDSSIFRPLNSEHYVFIFGLEEPLRFLSQHSHTVLSSLVKQPEENCDAPRWRRYQWHHQTCWSSPPNKHHHHIIITHCCLLFSYQQGHILLRQALSLLPLSAETPRAAVAKDNGIGCRVSSSCHRQYVECSTPFSTPVFPPHLCFSTRDPKFTLTNTQRAGAEPGEEQPWLSII